MINKQKITKRAFAINNLPNKYTLMLLLSMLVFACDVDTNHSETVVPFQCLSSQSVCEVTTKLGTFLVKFNADKLLTELPFSVLVELKQELSPTNQVTNDEREKQKSNDKGNKSNQGRLKIVGYMEGRTMFMGKIPVFFNKASHNSQHFIAETMLGSCSEEVMTWRLWLTIEKQGFDDKTEQANFFIDFNATRF